MIINYSGEKISEQARDYFKKLVNRSHELKHAKQIAINIKAYEKDGTRRKFDLHLEAVTDIGLFSSRSHSWLFGRAAKKAVKKLVSQIRKKARKKTLFC